MSAEAQETVDASCLVYGEAGILIRGASGSGKSSLCLELLDHAQTTGRHARLVCDDRVRLERRHGRVLARPHPALAGLIEIRGAGLMRLAETAGAAVLRLVVDLVEARARLPQPGPEHAVILNLALPRLALERPQPRAYLIRQALAALRQDVSQEIVSSRSHPASVLPTGPCDL